jgi:hypothetical protein
MLIALGHYYGLRIFVETGTYYGGTVAAVHEYFDNVYSIELDDGAFANCRKIFKDVPNVHILHGASGSVLCTLLDSLQLWYAGPRALFWLDAHAFGTDSPEGNQVPKELAAIERFAPESLVVIDDITPTGPGSSFMVNDTYPFVVPDGWRTTFVTNMSIAILHRGGYTIPSDLVF